MNQTAASYQLKHGLLVHIHKKAVDCMKKYSFSIKIDECTSNISQKVFSILVSYFDIEIGESVAQHYESISLIEVNAKSLLERICNCFIRDDIPFQNLVSDLSDSTNYMRGKRGGLEKLLRSKAPQLLDIDGDVCHHFHNTIKQFCKPFECFAEKWIDGIHWDTKYSTDILDSLKEICFILNVLFRKPPRRVRHHWLSVFNCLSINMTLIDPLVLLNYAWIPNDFREMYEGDIKTIFDKYELNEKAKAIINAIQTKMKQNELTDEGKECKGKIGTKLFYKKSTLLLNSNLFMSVALLFKSFILIFEQKEPLIHQLHGSLIENFRTFLSCFMKLEVFNDTPYNKLNLIDAASNV